MKYGCRLLLLAVTFVFSGCGGGSGGNDTDTTAPLIVSVAPTDGATEVAPDIVVSVTFSEDMFATTVDDSSFVLQDRSGDVSGTVNFDALTNIATFTPGRRLTLLGEYTANLSSGITDLSGNPLPAADWSFSVRDGGWMDAGLIDGANGPDARDPRIAIDSAGNALAAWEQSDGTRVNIRANRYVAGSGWGTAQLIETGDAGNASNPQIVVDAAGNALAVWEQSDDARFSVWANRYVPGSGWGTAELIETDDAGDAFNPQIAIDAAGNALAVWVQSDGARQNIQANRYAVNDGWGTAELIETEAENAFVPQIAVDAAGNAIAIWRQSSGAQPNIWANRYVADDGWGIAELIETDAGAAIGPQIAMDAAGNALAIWSQSDGTRFNIRANRYVVDSGWGAAELVETDDAGDAFGPRIAFDPDGNALAIWEQSDGTRQNIWTNRYVVDAGWATAELIETDDAGSAFVPQIAIDASGNALAVWDQFDGARQNIRANRYVAGSGWGTAELVETDDAGNAFDPQLAIDTTGSAAVVWEQSDGTRFGIRTSRFE